MSERFFLESIPAPGESALLEGNEAHHLAHVVRAKPGMSIELFDGQGRECSAIILAVRKQNVELEITSRRQIDRELACKLTLAVALPKGDRQRWLIEKATELGVAQIIPLAAERSVAEATDGALERMRRYVIEASKQCGRNRLMHLTEPLSAAELLQTEEHHDLRLVAHPHFETSAPARAAWEFSTATSVVAAIGPEGGFTPGELDLFQTAQWRRLSLGPRILRVETAALAIAALVGCA